MIRAAFYAPMKPPEDPVPSGDRAMARALMAALVAADVEPVLVSSFRSREGRGDDLRQAEIIAAAKAEIARLIAEGREADWRVWITYHNYFKAPDLIGPEVARALALPYVQVESTRAAKRLEGPWARFAQAAETATDAARAVLHVTERDAESLRARRPPGQIVAPLPPFLARSDLPPESTRTGGLLAVGMMRAGDKLASYRLIAEALQQVAALDWHLEIAGDGPVRAEVEALMAPFGHRVSFLGALGAEELDAAYGRARMLVWPGVNEAFGVSYLEAQAAGIPVIAQDRPGLREVLAPGAAYPSPEGGAAALAGRIGLLLALPKLVVHLGREARQHVAEHHLLGPARDRLRTVLDEILR